MQVLGIIKNTQRNLWKTYKTERTIDLPEGTYEIILGGEYEGGYGQISVVYNHL